MAHRWPPRALSAVYQHGLQTFHDLLLDLVTKALLTGKENAGPGHEEEEEDESSARRMQARHEAGRRLVRDGDPAEYLRLLKSSFAVLSEAAPALGPVSFEQRWTQQQIVERVIVLQFRQDAKPYHVLCSGYRKLRPAVFDSNHRPAPQGLECVCKNAAFDTVNSHSWKILLSRVGDFLMLHLLSYAAIFTPLPNNCFLQISGAPMTRLASMSQKFPALHPGEKMLGGLCKKMWISESHRAQQQWTGPTVKISSVEDEGKTKSLDEGIPADNNSAANEFNDGNWHGANVVNFGRKQCSDTKALEKPRMLAGLCRNKDSGTSNIICPSVVKRPRIEQTEFGSKADVIVGPSLCCDVSKSELASKRRRYGPREQSTLNDGILEPQTADTIKDCSSVPITNNRSNMPPNCTESFSSILCSKRKAPLETWHLPDNMPPNDNDLQSNCRKRAKLLENSEKKLNCQQVSKVNRKAEYTQSDLNVVQLADCSKVSKEHSFFSKRGDTGPSNQWPASTCHLPRSGQNANASSSSKRIRLPSWKRRKLRKQQECFQELVSDEGDIGKDVQVNILEEICHPPDKQGKVVTRASHKRSHLPVSGVHQVAALASTDFICGVPSRDGMKQKNFGLKEAKTRSQRRQAMSDLKTSSGTSLKLVDRASIFYNSSYSCYPGLPARRILFPMSLPREISIHLASLGFESVCAHQLNSLIQSMMDQDILNTTKANDDGVCHLFTTIFGPHYTIPRSSSGNHVNANCSWSILKPGPGCHSKSIHKLLKELISNTRHCAFARLLNRHCPLPDGFQTLSDGSLAPSAPLPSQTPKTEQHGSELVKDRHEDEQQEYYADHGPEVEEIMRLWLGPNYQPRSTSTTIPLVSTNTVQEKTSTSIKEAYEMRSFNSTTEQVVPACVPKKYQKKYSWGQATLNDNLIPEKTLQAELLSCYQNHNSVVGFLWAVFRSIVPQEMLGSVRSWRALRSSIAQFVGLRRHEKFNVHHALMKLCISSFSWLAFPCGNGASSISQISHGRFTVEERESQQKRLELWLYWLFTNLVVPVIRAHFYVTENENNRQNVFYYRKPVWARIQSVGLKELTNKNYRKLTKKAVAQVLSSRGLGFSQVRLLPKRTGLRPIANLAATSKGTIKFHMRSKGGATLHQGVEHIWERQLRINCVRNVRGFLCNNKLHDQTQPIVLQDQPGQDVAVFQTPSADTEQVAVLTERCLKNMSVTARGLLPSTGTDKMLDPRIQKRNSRTLNFSFRSINSKLRDVHSCLKYEKGAHPDDFGSSVFGYCEIHAKVLPFILQLKGSQKGMPRLFMAVCDVTKAYDTIQQGKLLEIVETFVQGSNYNVTRYTCTTPTLASVRVSHGRVCSLSDKPHNFLDSAYDLATKHSHCIFTDQALSTSIRREQVLAMLGEHLKQNIVQIGAHFYQQTVGIPQGSILSSLLCSLFYGHFDVHSLLPTLQSHFAETFYHGLDSPLPRCEISRSIFKNDSSSSVGKATGSTECEIEQMLELSLDIPERVQDQNLTNRPLLEEDSPSERIHSDCLQENALDHEDKQMLLGKTNLSDAAGSYKTNSLLLRLIDDSFFISTSETAATVFVESMHKGSEDYGCQANERKTAVSFCLQLGNQLLPRKVYQTDDGACFMQWSGLLVNCYTLEFQADYTRYCGEHIRSTLTVRRERNQGWHLVIKMCQYMRPKCHALFFDPRINSPATVRLNAFQAFLLCAMKFHAYVCCLPPVTQSNQPFHYEAIGCATRYMYGLLQHKIDSVAVDSVSHFPFKELEWLALVAFHRVLKRKQARHRILLDMLHAQLQIQRYDNLRVCPYLLSATDERRSSMFKFIKY